MNNDLIREIILSLTQSTREGYTEWKLTNSSFNSDTSKIFSSKSENGETTFQVKIDMDDNQNYDCSDMVIFNPNLLDKTKYLYRMEFKEIDILGYAIYEKYIKPNVINVNERNALEDILTSITSKSDNRDKKIEQILKDKQ